MKRKNKGFSLLELVISMALLTFVLVISSVLFERAIKVDKDYEYTSVKTADSYSHLQGGIDNAIEYMDYSMKKEKGNVSNTQMPDGYTDPIKVITNLKINPTRSDSITYRELEGYTVSIEKGRYSYRTTETGEKIKVEGYKVGYNNIDDKTKAVTFVGRGNTLSESSHVDIKIDSNDDTIFEFFPLKSDDKLIKLHYDVDNSSMQYIKTRVNYLKSPQFSTSENSIYKPYSNILNYYERVGLVYPSSYEYAKEATETDEKAESGAINWTIPSYRKDMDKYIDNMDRSYAASAITLNSNGKISPEDATFDSKIPVKHFIGLPFIDDLGFWVDYSLMIARHDDFEIIEGERHDTVQYLNVFLNPDKRYFNSKRKNIKNPVNKSEGFYTINFEDSEDTRDIINMQKKFSFGNNVKLSKAYAPEVEVKNEENIDEDEKTIKYPFVVKSYGSSVYFDSNEPIFEKFPEENVTVFVKLNNLNYDKIISKIPGTDDLEPAPYVLLSQNLDLNTGKAVNGDKGSMIYIGENGNIYRYEISAKSDRYTDNPLAITEIYDDARKFKFDNLSDFGIDNSNLRDGRKGFNICQIVLGEGKCSLKVLCFDGSKRELKTKVTEFIDEVEKDKGIFSSPKGKFEVLPGVAKFKCKNPAPLEVSDILVYNKKMDYTESIITMNYLYRKYLTPNERESFDKYYKSIL